VLHKKTFSQLINIFIMKQLLLLTALFTIGWTSAQEIRFENAMIDFGTITKGSDGNRIFKFTNTGTVALEIQKVASSCGCTIPKKPQAPIAPGETGEIQVRYDTNRMGPFRKTITVNSNAVETPVIALKIKGTVE
jgi:hypothetical protein